MYMIHYSREASFNDKDATWPTNKGRLDGGCEGVHRQDANDRMLLEGCVAGELWRRNSGPIIGLGRSTLSLQVSSDLFKSITTSLIGKPSQ